MGNVTLTDSSKLTLKEGSKLTIQGIEKVQNIEPVAIHLKEVNHIDPLAIDALHVNEVKNIEPLQIDKFNVTNLPMVNVSLQKLPRVGLDVKSLPPVSIGTYQNFCVPSTYTLHARVLGVELIRLHLNGQTSIIPKERARREQVRSDHQSFATTRAAGNPAIPSQCDGRGTQSASRISGVAAALSVAPAHPAALGAAGQATVRTVGMTSDPRATPAEQASVRSTATAPRGLSFGAPRAAFAIPDKTSKPAPRS